MGAFYRSYSVPGDVHEVVDQKVTTWLSRKGFSEIEDHSVIDFERESERAFYLFWNDRWTIILYSHFEEDERLLFELNLLPLPILHLWVLDSDVWGYELYLQRKPLAAFNSHSQYFESDEFADVPNDIPTLLAKCALENLAIDDIAVIQKKKSLFKERICEEFADIIDARPAAAQYDYLSEFNAASPGFSFVHRRFRKRGFDPVGNFDLHLRHAKSGESEAFPLPQNLPLYFRVIALLLRVIAIPLGWLMRFTIARQIKSGEFPEGFLGQPPKEYTFEGNRLENPKRRCRIALPEGAVQDDGPGILPFKIGEHQVIARAISANETMDILSGSQYQVIEEDSNFEIGSLPAKYVLATSTMPQGKQRTRYSYQYFIQAPFAIYHFILVADEALRPAEVDSFRETIESFEIIKREMTGE
jgi:hypothetical protein